MAKNYAFLALRGLVRGLETLVPSAKLHFQKVNTEKDLLLFQEEYWKRDGVRFPLDYLRSGSSFLARNPEGTIIGGFSVIPGRHLRSLLQLPDEARNEFFQSLDKREIPVEVTAVWLQREKYQVVTAASFWLKVFDTTFSIPHAVSVFACDLRKPGLVRMYESVSGGVVYRGPIVQLPGMEDNGACEEVIFFGRSADSLRGFYREFLRRLVKAPLASRAQNHGFKTRTA